MKSSCFLLITTCYLLLSLLLQICNCCSPKAVRSVLVGRSKAQAVHEAQKAKYLAGETKTLGQKLGLTKGGIIMEQIGVDRLRSEIKYLESVEKLMKKNAKQEVWLVKQVAKADAKGKPLKGAAAKMMAKKEAAEQAKSAEAADAAAAAAAAPKASIGALAGGASKATAAAAAATKASKGALARKASKAEAAADVPKAAMGAAENVAASSAKALAGLAPASQAATAAAETAKKTGGLSKFKLFSKTKKSSAAEPAAE